VRPERESYSVPGVLALPAEAEHFCSYGATRIDTKTNYGGD
jgi:hypothetical protein